MIITPILQMKKLRQREVQWPAQGHIAVKWWSLLPPASHPGPEDLLALAKSVLMEEECLEKQRRLRGRQDHTVPAPSTSREKGTEGSWKARLLAYSLMALFRYNVVWQCGYKKRCSLKTGAAQALSPPEDFFCKLFCSLQETLGMLLRIKRKESHLLT